MAKLDITHLEPMPLLIGLNGFKGVGKDTVGQMLKDGYDYKCISFAYKVKQAVGILLDAPTPIIDTWKNDSSIKVTVLRDNSLDILPRFISIVTMRQILQRMGTEVGRELFGADFWVDQLLPYKEPSTANADLRYHGNRVVTDARFENELYRIRELGGYNWRIERLGYEGEAHASEQKPPNYLIDVVIQNDGDFNDLRDEVHIALNRTLVLDEEARRS